MDIQAKPPARNHTQVAKDYFWPLFIVLVAISAFLGPKSFLLTLTWIPGMAIYVVSDHKEKRRVSWTMLAFLAVNAGRIVFDKQYPTAEIYWLVNKYLYIVILAFALEPLADDFIKKFTVESRIFLVIQFLLYGALLVVYMLVTSGHHERSDGPFYTWLHLAEDAVFGALTAVTIAMFKRDSRSEATVREAVTH